MLDGCHDECHERIARALGRLVAALECLDGGGKTHIDGVCRADPRLGVHELGELVLGDGDARHVCRPGRARDGVHIVGKLAQVGSVDAPCARPGVVNHQERCIRHKALVTGHENHGRDRAGEAVTGGAHARLVSSERRVDGKALGDLAAVGIDVHVDLGHVAELVELLGQLRCAHGVIVPPARADVAIDVEVGGRAVLGRCELKVFLHYISPP